MAAAKFLRAALAAGALLGLTGCAVMQIDVDVYKGPLANHEDVQTQQFAAMAIGARPLLEQLDNNLRAKEEYAQAQRVCDVLGLYEDAKVPPLLKPYLAETNNLIRAYEAAMRVLEPNEEIAAARWKRIEAGFAKNMKLPNLSSGASLISDKFNELKTEYREIIDPANASGKLRRARSIHGLYTNLLKAIENANFARGTDRTKILSYLRFAEVDSNRGSNAKWAGLADEKKVRIHADILFLKTAIAERKEFTQTVVATAQAFFRAREAIADLWNSSITTLILIQSTDEADRTPPSHRIDPSQRTELTGHLARLIASLTQPWYLAIALTKRNTSNLDPLRESLSRFSYANEFSTDNDWISAPYRSADRAIELALIENPAVTAGLLLKVNEIFGDKNLNPKNFDHILMRDKIEPNKERTESEFKHEEKRTFGIVTGPIFRGPRLKALIQDQTRTAIAKISGAFGGGRLAVGIETLIKHFVELSAEIQIDKKLLRESRNRLLDALVRFSQKVLVIANNEKLLSSEQANSPSGQCSFIEGDSSLKVADIPGQKWPEGKGKDKDRLDRYVLVLQAVGNSILIQANELRFREQYDRKLKGRLTSEIQAVERVLGRPPETMIDDVLTGLEADLTRTGQKLANEEKAATHAAQKLLAATSAHGNAVAARDAAKLQRDTARNALDAAHIGVAPIRAAFTTLAGRTGNQIRTAAETASSLTVTNMVAKIAEKLDELFSNVHGAVADQGEPARLALAKTYFGEKTGTTVTDFNEIQRIVNRDKKLADGKIAELDKIREGAQKDFDKKKTALANAAQHLKQRTQADGKTQTQVAETRLLIPKLENAVEMVEAHRVSAVEEFRKSDVDLKPSEVYARLIDWLARKKPNNASASKLTDAIEVLKNRGPPSDPLLLDGVWLAEEGEGWDPKHPNARDVLDTLIAALRQEHIEAVKETGPKRGRAPRIAAALKVAYEQRAGMAYIRPSAAYLRSSYPSTSLQDDPGLAWRNMLAGHALRSVPFIGQALVNSSSDAEKRKIVQEIDKQFWQSINRVRVAGAGDTNYVIAKDDIGNWYVKAFSADPKVILESAQKLALFNLGAQLDTNLLSRLGAKDGEAPENVSKPSLPRLFEEFEKDYAEKTGKDFAGLKARIEEAGLETSIQTAWSGIDDVGPYFKRADIESNLSTQFDTLQEIEFTETVVAEQSSKILATAAAVLRFHDALARAIRGRGFANKPSLDLGQKNLELKTANGELATSQAELERRRKERDAADQTVRDLLRADPFSKEALQAAQDDRDKKDAAVQDREKEVNEKKTAVRSAETAVASARGNLKRVQDAERVALAALKRVVRDELIELTARRNQPVKTFQTGVLFIGKATKPAAKP